MSAPISTFFDAWGTSDDQARMDKITSAVTEGVQYDDPRSSETIIGIDGFAKYVAMFSANTPGWTAKVVKTDTNSNLTRVTVAFGGPNPKSETPDENHVVQYGQYFIEIEQGWITKMVGFVGTGQPD